MIPLNWLGLGISGQLSNIKLTTPSASSLVFSWWEQHVAGSPYKAFHPKPASCKEYSHHCPFSQELNSSYPEAQALVSHAEESHGHGGHGQAFSIYECGRSELMGELVDNASPFLFPCTIEYSLLCAGVYPILRSVHSLPLNRRDVWPLEGSSIYALQDHLVKEKTFFPLEHKNGTTEILVWDFSSSFETLHKILFHILQLEFGSIRMHQCCHLTACSACRPT